ncbi:MAG: hypothetical protein KAR38_10075, partial [Calditrichia bacterium]|nr:hypothetical protein [Calditrichia bacterium]
INLADYAIYTMGTKGNLMPLDPVNYIVKENATVFPRLDQSLTQWETLSEIDSLWSDYHSYNGTWSLIMDSFHLDHWTNHQNYPLLESTLGLTTSFDLIGTGDEAMWKDSFFRGLGLKKGHYKEAYEKFNNFFGNIAADQYPAGFFYFSDPNSDINMVASTVTFNMYYWDSATGDRVLDLANSFDYNQITYSGAVFSRGSINNVLPYDTANVPTTIEYNGPLTNITFDDYLTIPVQGMTIHHDAAVRNQLINRLRDYSYNGNSGLITRALVSRR